MRSKIFVTSLDGVQYNSLLALEKPSLQSSLLKEKHCNIRMSKILSQGCCQEQVKKESSIRS